MSQSHSYDSHSSASPDGSKDETWNDTTPDRGPQTGAGTLLLVTGTVVVALCLMERAGGLPVDMPRSWYTNQPLWFLAGIIAFCAGCLVLRRPRQCDTATIAVFSSVILYTRSDCPLCDAARQVLQEFGNQLPPVVQIDVDGDSELLERFGTCIPVVKIDGVVRFRGQVNRVLLNRLITNARDRNAGRPAWLPSTGSEADADSNQDRSA